MVRTERKTRANVKELPELPLVLRGNGVEQAACIDLLAHVIGLPRQDAETILDRIAALYAAGEASTTIMRRLNPPAIATAEMAVERWEESQQPSSTRLALDAARDIGKPPPFIRPDVGVCIEEDCQAEFKMNRLGKCRIRCPECSKKRRQTQEGRRQSRRQSQGLE